MPRAAFLASLAAAPFLAAFCLGATVSAGGPETGQTPPNFKVAFIGDQGIGANALAVLQLIQNEGADMVLHQGDLGYGNETDPQTSVNWDGQITSVLGAGFPYFASAGNHEAGNWPTYRQLLLDRLSLVPGAACVGDYGVNAACTFGGLFFILSGAGTMGTGHASFIEDQLAQDSSVWRVCSWHKNQHAMQVGTKPDEVGWEPYEACRQGGAIIATGHEHSYERTKTLTDVQSQAVDPDWTDPNVLRVSVGSTFVFVAGLGGKSIRDQDRCLPATPPYGCSGEWATIHTSDQGAGYGALFIEFNVDGDPAKANGYFKDIDGTTVDSFTIHSELPSRAVGGIAEFPELATTAPLRDGNPPGFSPTLAVAIAIATALLVGALGATRRRRTDRRVN